MTHQGVKNQADNFLNLKTKILFLLRKHWDDNTLIYPKLLGLEFNRSKGAISKSLKQLESRGLIRLKNSIDRKKHRYRKLIKMTRMGYLLATQMIHRALNPKEILVLKSMNLGVYNAKR